MVYQQTTRTWPVNAANFVAKIKLPWLAVAVGGGLGWGPQPPLLPLLLLPGAPWRRRKHGWRRKLCTRQSEHGHSRRWVVFHY